MNPANAVAAALAALFAIGAAAAQDPQVRVLSIEEQRLRVVTPGTQSFSSPGLKLHLELATTLGDVPAHRLVETGGEVDYPGTLHDPVWDEVLSLVVDDGTDQIPCAGPFPSAG